VTTDAGDANPGLWIAVGSFNADPFAISVPTGYGAYAQVIHEPHAGEPPDALSQAMLHVLLTVLQRHTSTPDSCFFGQWTVWAHLMRPTRVWTFDQNAAHARDPMPRPENEYLHPLDDDLELGPDYRYELFSGPLMAAKMVGHWWNEDILEPQSPDLIWPQDRAWCVRRDGDSDTVVAGTPALIREVLARPELEARLL
jgi:hypothetical protein